MKLFFKTLTGFVNNLVFVHISKYFILEYQLVCVNKMFRLHIFLDITIL
jgi:hypothetical protein